MAKEFVECVVLSLSVVKTVCVDACVCVNIASPLLDPTSCITRGGSVLVAPGDSQSVLALQYKEIIVIFKKLPLRLGTVFCKAHVWDSST